MKHTTSHSAAERRAIILFVRDERREGALKPLPGRYRAEGYAALNRRVAMRLAPLLREGVDLLVVREGGEHPHADAIPQRGDSFGERIGNAMADAFARGYTSVAVVGNDCPTLSAADVSSAFDRLAAGASVVAAPARDGGAYLIAARAGALDLHRFQGLPWQTPALFASLVALSGACALPVLRDDFDCWTTAGGRRALDELFEPWVPIPAATITDAPIPSYASQRALTRIHLPAPPSLRTT